MRCPLSAFWLCYPSDRFSPPSQLSSLLLSLFASHVPEVLPCTGRSFKLHPPAGPCVSQSFCRSLPCEPLRRLSVCVYIHQLRSGFFRLAKKCLRGQRKQRWRVATELVSLVNSWLRFMHLSQVEKMLPRNLLRFTTIENSSLRALILWSFW